MLTKLLISYTIYMNQLILHPTSTAQWQALVQDAEDLSSIQLTETLESYLVFLLVRFMNNPEIAQAVMAEEFLNSMAQRGKQSWHLLRDTGDKCLLLSGLFPGRARKRCLRIGYFVNLGQSAYASLAEQKDKEMADLFCKLNYHFVGLMDVLHSMREIETEYPSLDFMQSEELWTDTRSVYALKCLKRMTNGRPLDFGHFPSSDRHH